MNDDNGSSDDDDNNMQSNIERTDITKCTHRHTEKEPLPITGSCKFNEYDWKNGEFCT